MVCMKSDRGVLRNLNEDYASYLETEDYKIYVVTDGMGGHNAGEIASKMAADGIIDYVKNNFSNRNDINLLQDAIKKVNYDIYNYSLEKDELSGMGTTITACLVIQSNVIIANVGDSSCYGINESKIEKITKDHSLVQELVDLGTITEEQAANHPKKNIITRAVGISNHVEVDIFTRSKTDFDLFLLCSDGLTNEVSREDIVSTIKRTSLEEACEKLVELANLNGGRDNITVLLFGGEN